MMKIADSLISKIVDYKINRLVLDAFYQAVHRVPAYHQILLEHGVRSNQIRSMANFQKTVPVIDKQSFFSRFDFPLVCRDGKINDVVYILTSSGHSGRFSYSALTKRNLQDATQSVDQALDFIFNVKKKSSFVINSLAMGVKITARSVTIADTGPRVDIVLAHIQHISPHYDQTILVGDPTFLKDVIETGIQKGIKWSAVKLHIIVGGDSIAEGWRIYIQSLLGRERGKSERGLIASSMGIAELGLNIFQESPETIPIRQIAYRKPPIARKLFGEENTGIPMLFQYNPFRIFAETNKAQELVVTTLSRHSKIPLIRYNTKDIASLINYEEFVKRLLELNLDKLVPKIKAPFVFIWGRQSERVLIKDYIVGPNDVKEEIYRDSRIASATTGNFVIGANKNHQRLIIHIQAKKGLLPSSYRSDKLKNRLSLNIPVSIQFKWYSYADFPWGMSVDYERKFNYILAEKDKPSS